MHVFLVNTELKDMLKSVDYGSRDASNDLLYQLGLIDVSEYLDTIKGEIGGKLDYLKSCDDFCSLAACDAITSIEKICCSLTPGQPKEKVCGKLVDFMLEQGLGQMIVYILVSLASEVNDMAFECRHQLQYVIQYLVFNIKTPQRVKAVFVRESIIPALINDLDSCDADTEDPRQRIRILDSIYGLTYLVDTPHIVSSYDSANAFQILMKFVHASDAMTNIKSLSLLCEIVNEEESQLLATTGNCMRAMVGAIQKAAKSDDRRYSVAVEVDGSDPEEYGADLVSLLYDTGKLTSNDAIKEAMVQHGGVPALTAILRSDYTDDEKQAAVDVLQKLASLESNRHVILTHLNANDEEALQGIYIELCKITNIICSYM